MFIALDKNNNSIDIDLAKKSEDYYCPVCKGELIIRDGQINIKHFAHKSLTDCDDFSSDISEWHRAWQAQFPLKNREVVIEHNGEKHRADVLAYGYVIEFQHSPISIDEFERRNDFCLSTGRKIIWIFDFSEERDNGHIDCYEEYSNGDHCARKYKWLYPKRFLRNFSPQHEKDIILFIQLSNTDFISHEEEAYFERVIWAIQDENFESDFSRYITDNTVGNKTELYMWLKEEYAKTHQ